MKQKGIVGIILIIIAILGVFTWEVWARKELTFDKVLVFNKDLVRAAEIRPEMLESKLVARRTPGAIMWKDREKVLGKVATQVIPKESEVFTVCLSDSGLVPDKDKFIVAIPEKMILSIPSEVKRGDEVFFYRIDKASKPPSFMLSARLVSVKRSSRDPNSASSASLEIIASEGEARQLAQAMGQDERLVVLSR